MADGVVDGSNPQRVADLKTARKRPPMTLTLLGGPTISEPALRCFLRLEDDGISVTPDANGHDLSLTPAERVAVLPYLSKLPKYKPELLALARYVADCERRANEVHASDVRWK
jgi:hypothetical protein